MAGNADILYDPQDQAIFDSYKWHINDKGYAVWRGLPKGSDKNLTIRLHRLISQPGPDEVVDHLNGNKLDNRRKNLRNCTQKVNANNRHNTRGVCFDTTRQKWLAYYKAKHIGRYDTEAEALRAYQLAKSGVPIVKSTRKYPLLPKNITKQNGYYIVRPQRDNKRIFVGSYKELTMAKEALNNWKRG